MANEAGVTVVLRMRDEASAQMESFGNTTQATQIEALQMNAALTAMGSAFTAVGALLGQIDSPMAKMASNFLMTGGAILTTTSAVIQMLPYIRQLITHIRTLAVAQGILQALSGPAGWIGLGIAAGAGVGIAVATRGGGGGGVQQSVNNYNIAGSVVTERELGEISRREIVKDADRNNTSGVR